jgi:hypothetical protein
VRRVPSRISLGQSFIIGVIIFRFCGEQPSMKFCFLKSALALPKLASVPSTAQ